MHIIYMYLCPVVCRQTQGPAWRIERAPATPPQTPGENHRLLPRTVRPSRVLLAETWRAASLNPSDSRLGPKANLHCSRTVGENGSKTSRETFPHLFPFCVLGSGLRVCERAWQLQSGALTRRAHLVEYRLCSPSQTARVRQRGSQPIKMKNDNHSSGKR